MTSATTERCYMLISDRVCGWLEEHLLLSSTDVGELLSLAEIVEIADGLAQISSWPSLAELHVGAPGDTLWWGDEPLAIRIPPDADVDD